MWYAYSFMFPTGEILSTAFNGIHEFGVGNGVYHPQYLVCALQATQAGGGQGLDLKLQLQTGHKPGPGASDFNPTPPNGYKATEFLLGVHGPRPLTFDVWHDFYAHITWQAYSNGILEIWHREGSGVFEKLYSNLNNGTALINRAPHPTLNWNDQWGAPGENGTDKGTMHMGLYRDAQAITDTYWIDSWLIRQSEAEILAEFGSAPVIPAAAGTGGQPSSHRQL